MALTGNKEFLAKSGAQAIFAELVTRLCKFSKTIASMAIDTKLVQDLTFSIDDVALYSAQIQNAALLLVATPGSKVVLDHCLLVKSEWRARVEAMRAIVIGMTKAGLSVVVTGDAILSQVSSVMQASKMGYKIEIIIFIFIIS